MPIFSYECEECKTGTDVLVRNDEQTIPECWTCKKPMEKVLTNISIGFILKGIEIYGPKGD